LVTAQSEFLIADISDGTAAEIAYFRVSSELRSAAVIDQTLLGLVIEPDYADSEALLIDVDTGQPLWRVPVQPGASAYGWSTHGIVAASDTQLLLLREDGSRKTLHTALEPTSAAIHVQDDQAILVSDYGRETQVPLNSNGNPEFTLQVHRCAGTAVTAANREVISSGADGSVTLTVRDTNGRPAIVKTIERRLRCEGAFVQAMKGDRELVILTANGAYPGTRQSLTTQENA
jgi:hypothetical protein